MLADTQSNENTNPLGAPIAAFDAALRSFRDAIDAHEAVGILLFAKADDWIRLLRFKLLPHLAGEGCLVVAVAGGTNCGKSTVFNMLLGSAVSPIRATAAATCHPVLAANERRIAECQEGLLVPEFTPVPLTDAEAILQREVSGDTLFTTLAPALPDRLILLDTPDVDSIDTINWEQAENIRAAGDVLIAVLTGEKYKDERVVQFFRQAAASGRWIVPLMNKADPSDDFEIARQQLDEFCEEAGIDADVYCLAHDFTIAKALERNEGPVPIPGIDGRPPLKEYILGLDVAGMKGRVFSQTVQHFLHEAGEFTADLDEMTEQLRATVDEFRRRAATYASKYDPAPGAEIGHLFHAFVTERRGPVRRAIGQTSAAVAKGATRIAQSARDAFVKRATLDSSAVKKAQADIDAIHGEAIEQIAQDLARSYFESARSVREPAAAMLRSALDEVDIDSAVAQIRAQAVQTENLSDEFREHAQKMLETWWADDTGSRRALETLDVLLAVTPIAIAAPMTVITGGFGVVETVTVTAGPLAQQFVARVAEYQFGDKMFDFLSPWKAEQHARLAKAIEEHLCGPALREIEEVLAVLEGESTASMRAALEQVRTIQAAIEESIEDSVDNATGNATENSVEKIGDMGESEADAADTD